jgi:DNA-binding transcriptional LysR family regulator
MSEPLRIQQIRQFLITAQTGNFRAAASGTFRSQAAVSAAMREMEKQIGGELFEKGRRAKLTPLAENLRPLFQELLTVYDHVISEARSLAQAESGAVSLAVVPVLAEEWLPNFVHDFVSEFPQVRVRATDLRSPLIRALVADGTIDIGVAGAAPENPKLNFYPIAADDFGVLCHPSHAFARQRSISWSALRGERFIGNDSMEALRGQGLGDLIENPAITVTSRVTLMSCVRSGLGFTIVPMLTKAEEKLGLKFIPLRSPRITRTLGIFTRRSQTMLPTLAAMHERLVASVKTYARSCGARIIERSRSSRR